MASAAKKPDRVFQLATVQKEALSLFTRKNKDYGDAFAQYGPVGVAGCASKDKIQRASNITKNGVVIKSETLRDTLMDLHNYAAMAVILMDE